MVDVGSWSWWKFSSSFCDHFNEFKRRGEFWVDHIDYFCSSLIGSLKLLFYVNFGSHVQLSHFLCIFSDGLQGRKVIFFGGEGFIESARGF